MNMTFEECPLYDENDLEAATHALMCYIGGQNLPEFEATNINHEEYTGASYLPEELIRQAIQMQYGRNIVFMANFLQVQDYFFSRFMPHISRYLDILKIDYSFSYFRPSTISAEMIMGILRGKINPENVEFAETMDPNIDWSAPSHVVPIDPVDPTNTFYTATLSIKIDSKYKEFYETLKSSGIINSITLDQSTSTEYGIIKLLPMHTPNNLVILRMLFHKYL